MFTTEKRTEYTNKKVKKGKVHPRTGHKGPGEYSYSSTLSLISALDVDRRFLGDI